ncbi:MAG: IPTL-CTERM sorting domain-containing protein [Acidobacteriota bacterium]
MNLEFTITNTDPVNAASAITFTDDLSMVLPGLAASGLPNTDVCGAGSSIAGTTGLALTNGSLAPGASCTFSVTLNVPASAQSGSYLNEISDLTASIGGTLQTGATASDFLDIIGAPRLSKSFTDLSVTPGGTTSLEFTLFNSGNNPTDATGIAFTDDLNAALAGLVATGLPLNDVCGPGSQISGTALLTFTGGTLAPGETCTFTVPIQVPAAAAPGNYTNVTSGVDATVAATPTTSAAASAVLVVAGLTFTKSFTDDPVSPGGTATLEFTIENVTASLDATDIVFTDNLNGVISGLTAAGLPQNDICGTGSSISGTGFVIFVGGNLTAGSSCTFSVQVNVPIGAAPGDYLNLTSSLTATLGGAMQVVTPAADRLTVRDALFFAKAFTDDPVAPGATVTLEFTLTNDDPGQAITGIGFTDDLDAALTGLAAVGLPQNDVCGAGSQISGTSLLTLSGGNLPAGGTCTFSVTLQVPGTASGSEALNVTSSATGTLGAATVTAAPASDTLLLAPLRFSKAFSAPTGVGQLVGLTFTIENLSTTDTVSGISFTDDLDAVVPGLVATDLPMADVCGAGSAFTGTSVLALSGATLGPSATCVFTTVLQVPLGITPPAMFLNQTSDVTASGLFAAEPATAMLSVVPPPTFAKAFAPASIPTSGVSTLTFTVDNTVNPVAATGLGVVDNLPAGVVVAAPANAANTCGGTLTAVDGSGTISLAGGTVGAGATCTFSVDVTAATAGSYVNLTGDLTSSLGNSGTATDTLVVEPPPTFAKAFAPASIPIDGVSTLTFTVDNAASTTLDATALDFVDNLPAGLVVATPANASTTCTGGTLTAADGSTSITYTGGSVVAGASCTIAVDVTSAAAGSYVNLSGDLTSSLGNSGTATDTLNVEPAPTFAKAFAPAAIPVDGLSALTFTIDNSASATLDAANLAFTDIFPAGLVIATPSSAFNSCGGTITAPDGGTTVTLAGGSVAPSAVCTVVVDVTSAAAGTYVNLSGDLTSSLGNSGAASDTLTVDPAPGFAKAFAPTVIMPNGVSTLTFTIDNTASVALDATGLVFDDNLPAGLVVANPANDGGTCGGVIAAAPGATVIGFTGGTVAAGATCTISVDVTAAAAGSYANVSEELGSSLGISPPATATLDVAGDVMLIKTIASGIVLPGGLLDVTYTITNPSATFDLLDIALSDDFGAVLTGLQVITPPQMGVCGAGSTLGGTDVLTLAGGMLAPGANCTFMVQLRVPADAPAAAYTTTTSTVTGTIDGQPTMGAPGSAMFTVALATLEKMFGGPTLGGMTTTLTFTITNPDPVNAIQDLTFTDDLDAVVPGLRALDVPQMDVCGVGSLLDGDALLTLTGGALAGGASCTFAVTVEVPDTTLSGMYLNVTSALDGTVDGAPVAGDGSTVAEAPLDVTGNVIAIPTLGALSLLLLTALLGLAGFAVLRRR